MNNRVIYHLRILTTPQIQKLSAHGFKAYRRKAIDIKDNLHPEREDFVYSEEHIQNIRTFDWLCNELNREKDRREEYNTNLDATICLSNMERLQPIPR
jgi:hypothetical protein